MVDQWSTTAIFPLTRSDMPRNADRGGFAALVRERRDARHELAKINLALLELVIEQKWSVPRLWPYVERLGDLHARVPLDIEIASRLWGLLLDISGEAFRQRQFDAARQALEAALAVGPRNAYVLRRLALAKAMDGQPGSGLDEAREACRLQPDNPENHRVLQQILLSISEQPEN
jgi:hypothetical protein